MPARIDTSRVLRGPVRSPRIRTVMTHQHKDNRTLAIAFVLIAVGLAATQDAVVKSMSGGYSINQAVVYRCLGSMPVLAAILFQQGAWRHMRTPLLPRIVLRSLILCSAYYGFVLSIAAMPIANSVAIYFTMPFFVAGLAGFVLGERVRLHRWLAIIAGFAGVMIMVRPGATGFEPAALLALYSAFGYAIGQMIGRPLAQKVPPVVIANWQNLIYLLCGIVLLGVFHLTGSLEGGHKSLAFLSRPWVWPGLFDSFILIANGFLAAFAMLLFVSAYKYAESNFVAPFEYSAMVWALAYGALLFGDFPDALTWAGAAIVVTAGLLMVWRDRQLDRIGA